MITFSIAMTTTHFSIRNMETLINIMKDIEDVPEFVQELAIKELPIRSNFKPFGRSGLVNVDINSDLYLWYLSEK